MDATRDEARGQPLETLGTIEALEAIEGAAWADVFEAAPPALRARLGLEVERTGGATILRAPGLDHVLFNRAFGLGASAPVEDVARGYAQAGVRRFFVQVREDDEPGLAAALTRAGLERYPRAWVKMARGAGPVVEAPTDLTVVRASSAYRAEIAALLGEAFDLPEEGGALLGGLIGRAGWHVYVALDGARVAAAGGLYVEGAAANLAFAATRPEHRGRGAQSALMARRLRLALDLGCTLVTSETGEAAPGDPQHSFRNMTRHGLCPRHRRANFAPAGVRWGRAVA
ncbi:MAG: hypothetical protein KF729_28670 [Sandaracinaceae bacterium]|nr:hypothetical protein [Sandaracinaceae bacterium]